MGTHDAAKSTTRGAGRRPRGRGRRRPDAAPPGTTTATTTTGTVVPISPSFPSRFPLPPLPLVSLLLVLVRRGGSFAPPSAYTSSSGPPLVAGAVSTSAAHAAFAVSGRTGGGWSGRHRRRGRVVGSGSEEPKWTNRASSSPSSPSSPRVVARGLRLRGDVPTSPTGTGLFGLAPDSSGGGDGGAPLVSLEEDVEGAGTDQESGMGSPSSSEVEVDVEVGVSTTASDGGNVTELGVGLELGLGLAVEAEVEGGGSSSSSERGDMHDHGGGRRGAEKANGEAPHHGERQHRKEQHHRTDLTEEFLTGPMLTLPRHSNASNVAVNSLLERTESFLRTIHRDAATLDSSDETSSEEEGDGHDDGGERSHPKGEHVFANSYVDLGKIDTIGFDFDYTLATYSHNLLSLIYDMALDRLVRDKQYPAEMRGALLGKFDAFFSIRGLAVDRETGWICHLSYTHKVAVAWEGRNRLPSERLVEEYKGKRSMTPAERRNRLKPLNDLFSMAECCLIADVVQFFNDRNIPYFPRSCVEDILSVIGSTHVSGDFHREVAANPELYFEGQPHLAGVLETLKESGKKLIFVSNSPFWYVHAGMNYVIGPDWRDTWDAVITSAGKPRFYTDDARPFREVSTRTGRIKFKRIDRLEPGEVYTEGCLKELTRCLDWSTEETSEANEMESQTNAGYSLASPNVLYVGDSLFADLVDAKREFGWTTAAVLPEVGRELEVQGRTRYALSQQTIELLIHTLRRVQEELGRGVRSAGDNDVIDGLEGLVSAWRDEQTHLLGNPFGSVFRARFQPSLFAHSLRRYCDLYMTGVESLRLYSPEHRFYPEDARLLGHEISGLSDECWNFDDI